MKIIVVIIALLGLAACGSEDSATIAIQVISPSASNDVDLREFNEINPPEKVLVLVHRSSGVTDAPVVDIGENWSDLNRDPGTGNPYMLIDVPPNTGEADPYILRLASLVTQEDSQVVDECGIIGNIVADRGAKLRLIITTHLGNCSWICATDEDCVGDRYCQSFECQDSIYCSSDLDCPAGAHCSAENMCSAICGGDHPDCSLPFVCCRNICSRSCATN